MTVFLWVIICVISLTPTAASIIVLYAQWKYYKCGYLELKKYNSLFYTNDLIIAMENPKFVYFIRSGSIQLADDIFIHNHLVTYFDPYSFYWFWKYSRCIKKHVLPHLSKTTT